MHTINTPCSHVSGLACQPVAAINKISNFPIANLSNKKEYKKPKQNSDQIYSNQDATKGS